MPSQRRSRRRFDEFFVAVHLERTMRERGMTYQELSDAMAEAGAPLSKSAIHRILKRSPPRRIYVDELAALSEILGIPLVRLVRPTEAQLASDVEKLIQILDRQVKAYKAEAAKATETIGRIALLLVDGGELTARLVEAAARHESAIISLIDTAVEAEERLRARATTAPSRARHEPTTSGGPTRDPATE